MFSDCLWSRSYSGLCTSNIDITVCYALQATNTCRQAPYTLVTFHQNHGCNVLTGISALFYHASFKRSVDKCISSCKSVTGIPTQYVDLFADSGNNEGLKHRSAFCFQLLHKLRSMCAIADNCILSYEPELTHLCAALGDVAEAFPHEIEVFGVV